MYLKIKYGFGLLHIALEWFWVRKKWRRMLNLYWNFCYSFCTFQSIDKNNNEKRTFISNVAAIRQSRTNNFSNIIIWQVLMFVYCLLFFFSFYSPYKRRAEPNERMNCGICPTNIADIWIFTWQKENVE